MFLFSNLCMMILSKNTLRWPPSLCAPQRITSITNIIATLVSHFLLCYFIKQEYSGCLQKETTK